MLSMKWKKGKGMWKAKYQSDSVISVDLLPVCVNKMPDFVVLQLPLKRCYFWEQPGRCVLLLALCCRWLFVWLRCYLCRHGLRIQWKNPQRASDWHMAIDVCLVSAFWPQTKGTLFAFTDCLQINARDSKMHHLINRALLLFVVFESLERASVWFIISLCMLIALYEYSLLA